MRAVLPVLAALALLAAGVARADCNVTLSVRNAAGHPVSFRVADVDIRSRVTVPQLAHVWGARRQASAGGWFDQANRLTLSAGEVLADSFAADLRCADNRQVRVIYRCKGGPNQGDSYEHQGSLIVDSARRAQFPVGQRC